MDVKLENLLPWSTPKRVETSRGPRLLQCANPNSTFWTLWRKHKDELKQLGVALNQKDGQWVVYYWRPLPPEQAARELQTLKASSAVDSQLELPAPDGLAYLPYQKAGIEFLLKHDTNLLADEMGLGKTIQAIGLINADPSLKKVCVVCPNTLKINWYRELEKWLVRPMTVGVAVSHKPLPDTDVVVINYDIVAKFASALGEYDLLVVDEAHYVKNPKAARTRAVYQIKARKKLAMTGTPMPNRPAELWPILNWLRPAEWPKFFSFAKRYCNAYYDGRFWNFSGASNLDELQRRLRSTVMVRRLKKDVLAELPAKRRRVIVIPAGDEVKPMLARQQQLWLELEEQLLEAQARVEVAKSSGSDEDYRDAVQALSAETAVAFERMADMAKEVALAKVPHVVEHVQECLEAGQKVLLFAHHLDVIDAYRAAFPEAAVVTGQTSAKVVVEDGVETSERMRQVDRFQTDPACRVFIGGIHAAGYGLTLTAADVVVFAELDWVPANMTQCEDRTHRVGQQKSILVEHVVFDDSLDVTIAKRLIEKQEIIDKALDAPVGTRELELAMAQAVIGSAIFHVEPTPAPTLTGNSTRAASAKEVDEPVESLTDTQVNAVHEALRLLADQCDGARSLDGAGFNKFDTKLGKFLASLPWLTPQQARLGRRIALRYRGQLPSRLVEQFLTVGRCGGMADAQDLKSCDR